MQKLSQFPLIWTIILLSNKRKYLNYHYLIKMHYYKHQQDQKEHNEQSSESQIEITHLTPILEESRQFSLTFIEELKEKALTPISQDVLDYYHGKIQPQYQPKDILHVIDKRISKYLFVLTERMIRNKKIKKNWNHEDIILLLWFVSKYMALKSDLTCQTFVLFCAIQSIQDWQFISKLIPGSSPKGCMFKFISLKKVKLSIYNWSQWEESTLKQLVKYPLCQSSKYGQNKWKQISEQLYETNSTTKIFRTPKQCRQHWNCYLDPNLKKGPWSQAEDVKLLENVLENKGQRKWSSIKYLFEGRTQNALKNRYNLLIQRQKKSTPNRNQNQLIFEYLKGKSSLLTILKVNPDTPTNSEHKSHKQTVQQEQIFQQHLEEFQKKQCQKTQKAENNNILKNAPSILIKSQRSSFKLSEAYQKRMELANLSEIMKQKSSQINDASLNDSNFVFMNLASIGSIFTNEQGFYTNIYYNPSSS